MNEDFHGLLYTVLSHPESLRFHRAGLLAYDERLCDGFRARFSRELLVVDSSQDPHLRSFLGFLRSCLPPPAEGPCARASAAARAVAAALGGRRVPTEPEALEERFEHRLELLHFDEKWHELPLGRLFGADVPGRELPGAGLQRHRAVLFKYACDALDICHSAMVAEGAGGRSADARDEPANIIWADGRALCVDCLEEPGRLSSNPALHLFVVREAQCRFGAQLAPPPPPPRPDERPPAPAARAAAPAAEPWGPAPAAAGGAWPAAGGGQLSPAAPPAAAPAAWPSAGPSPVSESPSKAGQASAGRPAAPTSRVEAYVYDITQGWAASTSRLMLGKQVDLIPHTGVVAFGREYYFGAGPCVGDPGRTVPLEVAKVLDLGETRRTREELEEFIRRDLAQEHTSEKYNLLYHNCNHFADEVARFLLNGRGLPRSIVDVAEEALSTPEGKSLRAMIEDMERSMRAGTAQGGASLNPFGDGGGGPRPAPARSALDSDFV